MAEPVQKELNKMVTAEVYALLLDMLQSIKYGSVTLIIQDGKVIQLEKNEKLRLK